GCEREDGFEARVHVTADDRQARGLGRVIAIARSADHDLGRTDGEKGLRRVGGQGNHPPSGWSGRVCTVTTAGDGKQRQCASADEALPAVQAGHFVGPPRWLIAPSPSIATRIEAGNRIDAFQYSGG